MPRFLPKSLLLPQLVALHLACGGPSENTRDWDEYEGELSTLEGFVDITGALVLEEPEGARLAGPLLHWDPDGGYLVSESMESQVRGYSPDGELRFSLGREGRGPGEFSTPAVTIRLPDGRLLVGDDDGRLTYVAPSGLEELGVSRNPFRQIHDLDVVNDSLVLVAADDGLLTSNKLHVLHVVSDSIVQSFFTPSLQPQFVSAATVVSTTRAAVWSDTIAAVFALSDSVFFFDTEGSRIAADAIPSRLYQPLQTARPDNIAELPEWLGSFGIFTSIHAGPSSTIVLQSVQQGVRSLIWYSRSDGLLAEAEETPALHFVDPTGQRLFFANPESLIPNTWLVGRLLQPQ